MRIEHSDKNIAAQHYQILHSAVRLHVAHAEESPTEMVGSCEYNNQAVADSREWVVFLAILTTLWFGCGGVVSVCRLKPAYGYQTTTAIPQSNTNTHRTRSIQPMK